MFDFVLGFVVLWFSAGLAVLPTKYLVSRVMNNNLRITEWAEDSGGQVKVVNGGRRLYFEFILAGLVGLWLTLGSLGAALFEYLQGTNDPKNSSLDSSNGDLDWFMKMGPVAVLVYAPRALAKFIREKLSKLVKHEGK